MANPNYLRDRIYIADDGCWHWTGPLTETGYGLATHTLDGRRRTIRAHRLVYRVLIGDIPEGLELDHLCRVRNCVNPYHLEPVTHRENQLRSDSISAQAARRTHCKSGHPLLPVPTPRSNGQRRYCPICAAGRWAKTAPQPVVT